MEKLMNHRDSSSTELTISYEGYALSRRSMSVLDLAPALTAWRNVFARANHLVNGSRASVDLRIFVIRPGSMEIDCVVEAARFAAQSFSQDPVSIAFHLRQLVVHSIALLKRTKGETHRLAEGSENRIDEVLEILDIDDKSIYAELSKQNMQGMGPSLIRLANDGRFRKSLLDASLPLARSGFDRITVKDGANQLESIGKEDLSYLRLPSRSELLNHYTVSKELLKIESPHFGSGNGQWRLHDGSRVNWYKIRDVQFLQDVSAGIHSFSAGDLLECEVRHTQWIDDAGRIKKDFEILHVTMLLPQDTRSEEDFELRGENAGG